MSQEGVPAVLKTAPWTPSTLQERVERGSHKSCQDHLTFLREELQEFMQDGYWTVLPYRIVKKILRKLRVSPMGVVPQ